MSLGLLFTIAGLGVAALSSVLGIWIERDPRKPPRWAVLLSVLIVLATSVGMAQSYLDAKEGERMEADLARMLATLDKLANADGNSPALQEMLKSEMNAQARANPAVMKKVAQRVADEGGDPESVLGAYLPASEVQAMSRSGGLKVAPPSDATKAAAATAKKEQEAKLAKAKAESAEKEADDKVAVAANAVGAESDEKDDDGDKKEQAEPKTVAAKASAAKESVKESAKDVEKTATKKVDDAKETVKETTKKAEEDTKAAAAKAEKDTKEAAATAKKDADAKAKKAQDDAKKEADKQKKKAEKDAKKAMGGLFK